MPNNIAEIKNAYNILVGGIDERAHAEDDEGSRSYGGSVRSAKGILVESIAKNLVEIAWKELKASPERLSFTRQTVRIPLRLSYLNRLRPQEVTDYIKAHIEQYFYGYKTDVHVNVDEKFVLGIECKAYTENAMLKRILVDFSLIKQVAPEMRCVLLQLESQLTGDYSKPLNPVILGSASSHTLMSYFDVDLIIITLLEGERRVDEPIHKKKYFKELEEPALKKAVQTFKGILAEFV